MEPDWEKIRKGLKKYEWLMDNLKKVNVSQNLEFQRKYNGFYKVRRGKEFRDKFYKKLESLKGKNPTFEEVLTYFWKESKHIEASFSSKFVATINPNLPVLDSEVLRNLGLKNPSGTDKDRLNKTIKVYGEIRRLHAKRLNSKEGKAQVSEFNKRFPNSGITDTKKIDLILWQTR
jgi:hypothetical protein